MSKGFTDGYKTYDTKNGFGNSSRWQNAFEERMNFKVLTAKETSENQSIVAEMYDCKNKAELKAVYFRLIKMYHPDTNGDTEENKTFSQLINDTYFKLLKKYS